MCRKLSFLSAVTMRYELNHRATQLVERVATTVDDFRVRLVRVGTRGFSTSASGPREGLMPVRRSPRSAWPGLGWVSILPGDIGGVSWPHVFVTTDHPIAACLFSQYAGWQVATNGFFAMGSGPMRAVYASRRTLQSSRLPRGGGRGRGGAGRAERSRTNR